LGIDTGFQKLRRGGRARKKSYLKRGEETTSPFGGGKKKKRDTLPSKKGVTKEGNSAKQELRAAEIT